MKKQPFSTELVSPIVYHGSPVKFEKFDYRKIGTNGTTEGFGFYFTDQKRIALNYGEQGYILAARLHGKALNGNEVTLTKEEYKKLVVHLDEADDYLSNYGEKDFEGYQVVLNRAMETYSQCEADSELIGGLVNSCGSVELVLSAVYNLFGYGYLVEHETSWGNGQKVYTAFTNDVIELVEVKQSM